MTEAQLQEIRERLESVAQWSAPWTYLSWTESDGASCVMCRGIELLDLVSCNGLTADDDEMIGRFVANVRQDVPDLLAEVECLRREVATLQGIISDQQKESGLYDAGWNAALESARLAVSSMVKETGPYYRLLDRISELRRP